MTRAQLRAALLQENAARMDEQRYNENLRHAVLCPGCGRGAGRGPDRCDGRCQDGDWDAFEDTQLMTDFIWDLRSAEAQVRERY